MIADIEMKFTACECPLHTLLHISEMKLYVICMQTKTVPPAYNPLRDEPLADLRLVNAPLVFVITQVRFAPVAKMDDPTYIADFQDRIRKHYPLFSSEQVSLPSLFQQAMAPGSSIPSQMFWRMHSLDGAWRVILTRDFLALETNAYTTRDDFLARWSTILDAFNASFRDITGTRFGLRYLNRIQGDEFSRLEQLVRPEALGLISVLGQPNVAITEVRYPVLEGQIHARWGFIPANATHDPSIMPSPMQSWILDTDLSLEQVPLDLSQIGELAKRFSARGYSFFHWMMTDAFRAEHSQKDGSK